jgi:putative multiple sugar transport system substrate-binding protein
LPKISRISICNSYIPSDKLYVAGIATLFNRRNFSMKAKKILGTILCAAMAITALTGCSAGSGKNKVGVSMPTKDLQRWNQDGDNMKKELEAAGYEVDLQYANNDVATQLSQVENMINSGCKVIVIAAIEGSSLGTALDKAAAKKIPVIAYDRLLMDNANVDYYATFDNYMVGTIQGTYVKDTLDLDNAAGPFNIEFTAGDPGDNNAGFFFNGAYDVLKPYIDSGKLVVVSGQNTFEQVATPSWKTETAQSRAENILSSYYADGTNVDVWLCSNDSTALGVENALATNYNGSYPIITGQDCDIANVKNMLQGKQSMSVFKDTRTLASQVVKMVTQILKGETVEVNDTSTYDNGKKVVPSYLCSPVFASADNYKTILIDSGYYKEADLA